MDEARARFMEEPPPERFFPRVGVGQGATAFRGYISPEAAANFAREDDEYAYKQDRMETDMDSNALTRLQNRSRSRLLPYTEAAGIAAARTSKVQSESAERLNPFMEQAQKERALTDVDQYASERRVMPGQEKLEIAENQGKLEAIESGDDKLRSGGISPALYDMHLRRLPQTLPRAERQRQARIASLRIQNEQPEVQAIEEELMDLNDPAEREKYLQDDMDDETGLRFTRINPKASPAEINRLLAKARTRKFREAKEKEGVIQLHRGAGHLDDIIGDYTRQITNYEKNPVDGEEPAEIKAARAERAKMIKQRGLILQRLGILPGDDVPAPASTGTQAPSRWGKLAP